MTIFAYILAVALSLESTNDYRYLSYDWPTNADIRGIGMGTEGLYSVPRLEDAAFLTEAWIERADALKVSSFVVTNRQEHVTPSLPLPIIPRSFTMLAIFTSPILFMFPESFDSPLGIDVWTRGDHDSFTSMDFSIAANDSPYLIPCNTDWTIGVSTNLGSVKDSYVPLISTGYHRLVPPALATNTGTSAGSVYRKSAIVQLYTNLTYTGRIVNANGGIVSTGLTDTVSLKTKYRTQYPTSWQYAEYDIKDGDGNIIHERTNTGYSLSPVSEQNSELLFTYTGLLPENQSVFSHEAYSSRPIDVWWKRFDGSKTYWEGLSIMNPYRSSDYWMLYTLSNSPTIKIYSPLITTNNFNLCSDIEARLVAGISRIVEKGRRIDKYPTRETFVDECLTNHYITSIKPDLTRLNGVNVSITDAEGTRICPVFSTDQSVSDIILRSREALNEPDYMNDDLSLVYGRTDTLPTSGETMGVYPPDEVSGVSYHYRTIEIKWLRVIFTYNRDYHAKTKD